MRRGWTLIELLVVLGIISLLLGVLMPMIAASRRSAQRTTCRSQLRQIGTFLQMYLTDSNGRLPHVNTMPSVVPPLSDAPSLPEVLRPYAKGNDEVYHCPADRITQNLAGSTAPTYFEREGSSYQYNPFLAAAYAGRKLSELPIAREGRINSVPLVNDYEPFHGRSGTDGSTNYLFPDGHVRDLAQE